MQKTNSLSVIIPAFNEEAGINNAVTENLKVLKNFQIDFEIIIVDDGSSDGTETIIRDNFLNHANIRCHFKKKNEGFGSACKKGIELAGKENVILVSVDSPLTSEIISLFYQHINNADILVGYRIERKGYTWRMKLNSLMFHWLVSHLFDMKLKDYNWLHLYKREIFQHITIEYSGIFMLAEVLIKARRNDFRIVEIPVEMIKRSGGVATAGSWKTAFQTAGDLFSFYFTIHKRK